MSPDLAASVMARLLALAKQNGEEFERTLTRFAAERLLFRLGESRMKERCILKGASLLSVWLPNPHRATRDIDVLAYGPSDDAAIRDLIEDICAVPCPEDALRFDLSDLSIESIRDEEAYSGHRARFRAHLGRARIQMQVDIGRGDALGVEAEEIEYPAMLHNLRVARLRAYPREVSVAEKFEAMVKLDTRNSRMKDFHDVYALANAFAFDGRRLREAIAACFERRATPWIGEAPRALTSAFYQVKEIEARWRSYLAGSGVIVSPPARFEVVGEQVIRFLDPVRRSIAAGKAFEAIWVAGGPWGDAE